MKKLFLALFTVVVTLYPIFIYFAFTYFSSKWVAIGMLLLFLLRGVIFIFNQHQLAKTVTATKGRIKHNQTVNSLKNLTIYSVIIGVGSALGSLMLNTQTALLFYPVFINALLFILFFLSLFQKMSIIEHFARLKTPDLPAAAIHYTRNVTKIWCVFFILNGLIALYTIYLGDLSIWTLYNGLISYILMAILFVTELAIRHYWQSRFID